MIKLNIVGNFFGIDGYSNHTRNLANALNNIKDIEVTMTTFQFPPDWQIQVSDKELEMFKRDRNFCDINLCIMLPLQAKPFLCENKKNILFVVWEGSRVPLSFMQILFDKRVNQIWVPSLHVEQAIQNTVSEWISEGWGEVMEKIHIVPHGVDTTKFYPIEK